MKKPWTPSEALETLLACTYAMMNGAKPVRQNQAKLLKALEILLPAKPLKQKSSPLEALELLGTNTVELVPSVADSATLPSVVDTTAERIGTSIIITGAKPI